MQIAIFGKTPLISLAEVESVLGSQDIVPLSDLGCLVDSNEIIDINRLGGTLKIAKVVKKLDTTNWSNIRNTLENIFYDIFSPDTNAKLKFGISVYGKDIRTAEINATALSIKKQLKNSGVSSRVIASKGSGLNTAQIIHGGLTKQNGIELTVVIDGKSTYLCQTTSVQDIDAYSARDQARPKRDSFIGMLPPKLAQTIINLSGAKTIQTLLDPFCGTGVVLQEALLLGINTLGSDINERMIEYSTVNIDWLQENFNPEGKQINLHVADATDHKWQDDFDVIACETYLGRPLSSQPSHETMSKIISDCNTIHQKFLINIARQTKSGFMMCIAVPAWHTKNGFKHLKVLDDLSNLGYNRLSFVHTGDKKLIYHRKGQFTARELVVLERT